MNIYPEIPGTKQQLIVELEDRPKDSPSDDVKLSSGTAQVQRGSNSYIESDSSEQSVDHRKVSINAQSSSESENITINDPEFNPPSEIKKLALAIKIFCKSFKETSQVNNPETDRSERVESIRKKTFTVSNTIFEGLSYVMTAVICTAITAGVIGGLLFLSTLDPTIVILFPLAPFVIISASAAIMIACCKLATAISSFITSVVSASVDTHEKLAEMTSSNRPEAKFLSKHQRMEASLRALQIRRYLAKSAKIDKMADSPLKDELRTKLEADRLDENIPILGDEKWYAAYQRSCLEDYEGNIKNLDDAISKTRDWLNRAEKQKNQLNKAQHKPDVEGTYRKPDTEPMDVRYEDSAEWISV